MYDSDQYAFPHCCTLEAMRTQGRFYFSGHRDVVFVIGVVAQMMDAEVVRPPGVNLVEVVRAMNRKISTVAVPAQFVGFGDEDGDFDALSQIRRKLGVVIGDP